MKEVISFILLIVTILLVDLFWMFKDEPFHWFFLIGFILLGAFWNKKVL